MVADSRKHLSDSSDTEEDIEEEFVEEFEEDDTKDAAEHAIKLGMKASVLMEILICITLSVAFRAGQITIFCWTNFAVALFMRAGLWLLKVHDYRWGTRLLLPSFLAPCCVYAFVADQVLIETCQVEVALVNVSTWSDGSTDAVGLYPYNYLECHDHRNGTLKDILLHELNRSGVSAAKYSGGTTTQLTMAALSGLRMCLQYGVPVLFGYIFVKGEMMKAMQVPGHNKQVTHNVRLFVLDVMDICGFATLSFDITAHIWFRQHRTWSYIKLAILFIASLAGFAEVLLGLLLKAEEPSRNSSPRNFRRGMGRRSSNGSSSVDDDEEVLHQIEGTGWVSGISFFFIDVPLASFRLYLWWCGVQVRKLYLLKNIVCAVYEIARALGCQPVQKAVESVLVSLPGVEQVEIQAMKHKEQAAKDKVEKLEEEEFGPGMRVIVTSTFTSDSEEGRRIKRGMKGSVIRVDKDGDAFIKFHGMRSNQWVFKHNFNNLDHA